MEIRQFSHCCPIVVHRAFPAFFLSYENDTQRVARRPCSACVPAKYRGILRKKNRGELLHSRIAATRNDGGRRLFFYHLFFFSEPKNRTNDTIFRVAKNGGKTARALERPCQLIAESKEISRKLVARFPNTRKKKKNQIQRTPQVNRRENENIHRPSSTLVRVNDPKPHAKNALLPTCQARARHRAKPLAVSSDRVN